MDASAWRSFLLTLTPGLLFAATAIGYESSPSRNIPALPADPYYEPGAQDESAIDQQRDTFALASNSVMQQSPNICPDGACGCGSSCCNVPMDTVCCGPLWTARAGAIFLRRTGGDDLVLSNGATPINAGNLDFNYEAGPLVTLIRHGIFDTAWDLEATYFGVHGFDAAASSAGATVFFSTPAIVFGPRTVTTQYQSRLDSTEINLRRAWNDWLTVLGGFRWLELGENLNTDFVGASHAVNVNNHLYGFQIGANALLWKGNALSIEGFGKAGIYGNSADQTTNTVGVGGAVPSLSANGTHAAFIGEVALTGVYAITDHWSIRGGYQVLWVDNVAVAPDQLANSNLVTGAAALDLGGNLVYHGFTAAAECRW